MLKRLELPLDMHHELLEYCNSLGIEFLSTAFDEVSLRFLVDDLGLKRLKLPSGELTNAPLVLAHAQTGIDLIVSTGMASLAEIEEALGIIAFGYISKKNILPSKKAFQEAYSSKAGQEILREKVTLLQCTTEYPAPMQEINLNVMDTFKKAFGLKVGYSDHSQGVSVPIAAVTKGAVLIEKHFTLDKKMKGPDHKASLEPSELKLMVKAIRDVELALGSSVKVPTVSEVKNKNIARKSLIASKVICKGEKFTEENISIKRPGGGIDPINYWDMIGTVAVKNYDKDELL
jgi:N-acetylneuraminate synthase